METKATKNAKDQQESVVDYNVESGDELNFKRLKLGGGDIWLIQLDGSVEGIDYEFHLSKLVKLTSQLTKRTVTYAEAEQRYFTYATVISIEGISLRLPMNEGLYLTHYNRYMDAKGKITPDHSMDDLKIAFKVTIEADKQGNPKKNDEGQFIKTVTNVIYTENVLETA